ncbi:MAG: hypothetical protein K6357_04045 [Elusimicrobiota bacterium]
MDIIYRLRVIFWFLVVFIWGIYLYQYISEDIKESNKNKIILNTKRKTYEPIKIQKKNDYYQASPIISITTSPAISKNLEEKEDRIMIAKTEEIKDIAIPEEHYKYEKSGNDIVEAAKEKKPRITVPDGFKYVETRHFHLYVETGIDAGEIETEIEKLHGEIMLDLIAFSPWTRDEKVHIYLAKTSQKYQELSQRPPWSGGAANLREKKIYLYKSGEWFGILAHELTHIYFDSFFGGYDKSPLWLSEGMAVYIQVQRGNYYPNWLKENITLLKDGNAYKLADLIMIKTLEDASDKSVKLWYAQSYSLVYLLLKIQQGDSFYQFCKRIKEGDSVSKALFNSYGKPYTSLRALESVWQYQIKHGSLFEKID